MSKVICDICGTVYSASSAECPICGYSNQYIDDSPEALEEDSFYPEMDAESDEIHFFDGEFDCDPDEEPDDEFYEYEQPKHNTPIIVFLVVLITLLLLGNIVLFLMFYLPNEKVAPESTAPAETYIAEQTETTQATTLPGIPCTNLSMPGGKVVLANKGQFWLLNVQVFPSDTTDELTYRSENENVAVVSEKGKVTAVGEGETVIVIRCGENQLECNVLVDFNQVTEPADGVIMPEISVQEETEATVPENTESASEETPAEASTESTEKAEETIPLVETEPTTEPTKAANLQLKLKQEDITIAARQRSVQLEMDCDIPITEVKWLTMDSAICIVHDGLVTALGPGTTKVVGQYEGQTVECIVRCNF